MASLAGKFAMSAATSAGTSASQAVGQTIGKPLDALQPSGRAPGHSEINWVDFNYPPYFRLIHYDLDELPSGLSGIVRLFHLSFVLATFTCLLNLFDTTVIVIISHVSVKVFIQSALLLVILPAVSLGTFYAGYRGLAEPDTTLATRFKVAQPTLAFMYFLMGIVPFGCSHGLAELGKISGYTDGKGSSFWTIAIIVESALWLSNALVALINSVRASKYDTYDAAGPAGRF